MYDRTYVKKVGNKHVAPKVSEVTHYEGSHMAGNMSFNPAKKKTIKWSEHENKYRVVKGERLFDTIVREAQEIERRG